MIKRIVFHWSLRELTSVADPGGGGGQGRGASSRSGRGRGRGDHGPPPGAVKVSH